MEEEGSNPQLPMRMFTTTQDYQEISGKFTKIFKLQNDGLTPPTFTPSVISKFIKILNQAKTASMQNKSSRPSDFVSLMAPFIPKIVELSSQNFLDRTIRDFQALVSKLIKGVKELSESNPQAQDSKTPISRVSSSLSNLMPKALLISYGKVSPASFNTVQQTIHTVQADILNLRETPYAQGYEHFQSLVSMAHELECSIKHIVAAHSFISIASSLQNSLRHFTFDDSMKPYVLQNAHEKLKPSPPKTNQQPDLQTANEILQSFLKNPAKEEEQVKEKFINDMEKALKEEMKFESCTAGIESIIFVILTIQPPQDPAKKVFTKCSNFYFSASRAITQLYKLPEYGFSVSDIAPFVKALDALKQTSDSIIKARKKPVGWSAQDTKNFMKCTEPIIKLDSILQSSLELVMKANEAVGKQIFKAKISKVLPKPISMRFLIPEECSTITPQMKRFNIIRGLALSQKMIQELSDNLVFLKPKDGEGEFCLHPADFSQLFAKIRSNVGLIEQELFHMSLDKYNEFPSSKNGTTMISALSEISRKLEEYILTMNSLPLEIASLREISMILYEQGFSLNIDPIFTEINKDLNFMFEVYQVFEHLDLSGSANLSTCSHLSFFATTITELASQYSEFTPFAEFFKNLNLFDLDMNEILQNIAEFRKLATSSLIKWACADLITRFTQQYKSTYTAANIIRNEPLEPMCSKLLGQLTGWLSQLPRGVPKHNSIREMHIRMTILKKMLSNYLSSHSDCQAAAQFEQIFSTIDLIGQLSQLFALRSVLKSVLTFTERINTGSENEIVAEESSSEQDQSLLAQGQLGQNKTIDALEDDKFDLSQISFTDEEKELWKNFAEMVFSVDKVSVHPQFPSYTEKLVHSRARAVYDEFLGEWSSKEISPFQKELNEINNAISQPSYDNETLHSQAFNEKVIFALEQELDTFLSQLIEFNPPSRGRGYPRENPPHPKAQQIGELYKSLSTIKGNLHAPDFSWLSELLDCKKIAFTLFRATDVTSEGTSPLISIRKLANESFAFFRLIRCLLFAKGSLPTFDPDLKMLKILIGGLSEKTRFIKENSPLLFHEIDQVIKSNAINSFSNLVTSVKILSRSRTIFDVKELVTMANNEFFDFNDFFSKLPCGYSTLSSFLNSTIYELISENTKTVVVRYILSKFSNDFISNQFQTFMRFKKEFAMSPVQPNWEKTDENISILFSLQQLIDISLTFDRVKPLVQVQEEEMISGTDFLAIQLLIFILQNEIENLVQSKPNFLCKLYINLTKVLTAMRNIPNKFGQRKINDKNISALRDQWSDFVENFMSLPMSCFSSDFGLLSNKIIDAIQECEQAAEIQSDLKTVIFLVKQYLVLPEKEALKKIKLSFQYMAAQVKNYSKMAGTINDLPFFQLQVIISAMLSMHTICELIPIITDAFEKSLHCTLSHRVPTIIDKEESETKQEQSEVEQKPSVTLDNQLSLFEQTSVGHMTAALFDANLADQEKIITLPLVKREVERGKIMMENCIKSNQRFEEINECLQNCKKPQEEGECGVQRESHPETEGFLKAYESEKNAREVESRFSAAKKQYEHTMENVSSCLDTRNELRKSLVKMENRKSKNEIISQLNKFEAKVKDLSSSQNSLEERAKSILHFDEQ